MGKTQSHITPRGCLDCKLETVPCAFLRCGFPYVLNGALLKGNMKFLRLYTTDPYYNLAVEEYLFLHAEDDIFMLWQNDRTVVIGKNQNAYAELDVACARQNGIRIARRITGGGAVYHDMGNLNYTYISRKKASDTIDFAPFCAPILAALRTLGIRATLSGRNDLVVDGKKISGNAQHTANGCVLHHGTLLYNSDLTVLSTVLRTDSEKLKAKSIRSVSSRVMNLSPVLPLAGGVEELADHIFGELLQTFGGEWMEIPKNSEIETLAARNASDEWIFPERPILSQYTLSQKRRYPYGSVEVTLLMSGETIQEIHFEGDFFGAAPLFGLEQRLVGATSAEIASRLENFPIEQYIYGMSSAELTELIGDVLRT